MIKGTLPLCKILLKILKEQDVLLQHPVILMGDGAMRVAFMRNLHCGGAPELLVKQEWL